MNDDAREWRLISQRTWELARKIDTGVIITDYPISAARQCHLGYAPPNTKPRTDRHLGAMLRYMIELGMTKLVFVDGNPDNPAETVWVDITHPPSTRKT